MIDFRPALFVIGILLTTLSVAMLAPFAVDVVHGNPDWQVFAGAGLLTLFVGGVLVLTNRSPIRRLSIRQAFVLTTASWIALTTFAALPFVFSELKLTYADAFFEAMSGITTTGSTVITGLDQVPKGIILWRALLQWLGGIGIIVMAIAVLPMLRVGGMQLFKVEAFDAQEKILPRAGQISVWITIVYVALTLIWWLGLWLLGLDSFDAIVHAMTTIATGGYSSSDGSIGSYGSRSIEIFVIAGMLLGSLPFILYLRMLREGSLALFRDSQVRCFLMVAAICAAAVSFWLWQDSELGGFDSLVIGTFNTVSLMTGTGFTSGDYQSWGAFPIVILFFLMFVGGCAGSTSCGIKIFRFQVLFSTAKAQFHRLLQPHGIFVPHYNHRPIQDDIIQSVMNFFFLFIAVFVILTVLLGMLGLDYITAITAAATAICNVGPAMGPIIGPSGNFAPLPESAKWLLSAGMLFGRLEIFTVLVLFLPSFWRN
ncbi:MAG: TrkH family potassium uptake protein [Rhodospirillaceae bacterium]|jgi:trk system potassium uptake protein|nr:TrkH family potassium uptake protein [Rhodospirillaceae bacterium]MBT5459791.1 TrkH family potassium uptake protein [Rhodospirillaceae bacterium]